jgi:hypothetical protein
MEQINGFVQALSNTLNDSEYFNFFSPFASRCVPTPLFTCFLCPMPYALYLDLTGEKDTCQVKTITAAGTGYQFEYGCFLEYGV